MRAWPSPPEASATERALAPLGSRGLRLGTRSTRALLAARGNADHRVPLVAVAGTNGKGSTAALLSAISLAAGYRTGLFVSPALRHPWEHVFLDGRAADDLVLATKIDEIIPHSEHLQPGVLTAFEALVVAAIELFAEAELDLAILEAGLGGARDAINATEPMLSIITTVGGDHRALIGPTRGDIAREKAGVLRAGRPAVVGWLGNMEPVVREIAIESGTAVRFASEVILDRRTTRNGLRPQRVTFTTDRHAYDLQLPLLGDHQADNVALASLASELLADNGFPRITPDVVALGVPRCRWLGRLEAVSQTSGRTVLLDSAHNTHAAAALARFLKTLDQPYDLIFGVLRDKDAEAMLAHLAPGARHVALVAPGGPRSWDPTSWLASHDSQPGFSVSPDLAAALQSNPTSSRLLVVSGSLYLIGQVRRALGLPSNMTTYEENAHD